MTLFFLDQFNRSIENETIFSNTAIIVERAAKFIKTKNKVPQIWPFSITLKIFGSVTKTNPGPLPASTPKDIQAGKIINPAIVATKVSSAKTRNPSPVKECSLPI